MKTSQVVHFDTDGDGALSIGISNGKGIVRAHFEFQPTRHHLTQFNVGMIEPKTARALAHLLIQAADLAETPASSETLAEQLRLA